MTTILTINTTFDFTDFTDSEDNETPKYKLLSFLDFNNIKSKSIYKVKRNCAEKSFSERKWTDEDGIVYFGVGLPPTPVLKYRRL